MQIKTKKFSCHTADSKPVKQEVNGTIILPRLVFLVSIYGFHCQDETSERMSKLGHFDKI
jgi:hypothetical protein